MLSAIDPGEGSNLIRLLPRYRDRSRQPSRAKIRSADPAEHHPIAASDSDWDGIVLLRPSAIRVTPRWRYALRRLLRRPVRLHVAVAALLAAFALILAAIALLADSAVAPRVLVSDVSAPISRASEKVMAGLPDGMRSAKSASLENAIAVGGFGAFPAWESRMPAKNEARVREAPRSDEAVGRRLPLIQAAAAPAPALTRLIAFNSAPFPYEGRQPTGAPFLNVMRGGERGHRTWRGQVLWEAKTFSDSRVLLHIPAGFDPDRPAVMVVFFHGYGATLSRDVLARQQVPAQVSASGANAVLVAPQFAVDARDSSAGRFWQPGGFSRFLREAARQLARLRADPASQRAFARMPVVLVGYSGGFLPAAFSLKDVGATNRVRGVLLLDAAYGELDVFADWIAAHRSAFLVCAYTHDTQARNVELERMLARRGISYDTALPRDLSRGGVSFLHAESPHRNYVTQAWTEDPIKDILMRLPGLRVRQPEAVASIGPLRAGGAVEDAEAH